MALQRHLRTKEKCDRDGMAGDMTAAPSLVQEWTVPAELSEVVDVRDRVSVLAAKHGLDEDAVEEVRLAIGEAFVNAVRHGGKKALDGKTRLRGLSVTVRVLCSDHHFIIEVKDCGPGFVPDALPLPRLEDMRPDGRGVFFMKMAMDEVTYDFSDGTVVRMCKARRRSPNPENDSARAGS